MLDALDQYYRAQGIPAIGFNCKYRDACSALCAPGKMVSVPESYVGLGYEEGKLPRLLFVSSETNNSSGWENPERGALRGIRAGYWETRNLLPAANTHWYQTLDLARVLLAPYAEVRLRGTVTFNDFVGYIANARSTRCRDSGITDGREGNPLMSANCRGFLKGEIEVMRPDIIVVQGARARNAQWNLFPVIRKDLMPGYPATFCEIVQISETHTAIKLVAKHPCARNWKPGEKKAFADWAAQRVRAFIPVE
jgi:hypothetical protein